jgi:hypothetical protein
VLVWAGRVQVRNWVGRADGVEDEWQRRDAQEHLPVHGASLGIDAPTYVRAGGFLGLVSGEDKDLVDRALDGGAVARSDAVVRVSTSGRRQARAPQGFAAALSAIEDSLPVAAAAS